MSIETILNLVVLCVIVAIGAIATIAIIARIRRHGQQTSYNSMAGGIATWLASDSHLLVHMAEFSRATLTDELLQSLRQHEPWIINAVQAGTTYLAGGQSFYLICLYDQNQSDICKIEDGDTHIALKECLCRLLFAFFPAKSAGQNEDAWLDWARTHFELFLIPLNEDLSVRDSCFNLKHARNLPGSLEIWIAEDMPLNKPLHTPNPE
ncbi:MAG: hypothetical protein WC553_00965 [Patescibacteria group bacterium]|jgi:hypothetical protein